jgi:hypothetical protein
MNEELFYPDLYSIPITITERIILYRPTLVVYPIIHDRFRQEQEFKENNDDDLMMPKITITYPEGYEENNKEENRR